MIEDKTKQKYECSMFEHGFSEADDAYEKELLEERAWLFYESGVQDMREIKSLLSVYKF